MNTEQIKQEILNRLAAFPNSPIIREVGELVKAIGIADEPFAWATFDGEGGYDLRLYEDNENYAAEWVKVNGKKYDGWVVPLYRQGT